jgi:cyclopropane fatty-acyl-phospholipid synthase-like methyltransferase
MTEADFEERYRADIDPWSYTSSDYERRKYDATLAACAAGRSGPVHCALELGASIGVFSGRLASHCETLVTVDAAPSAVAAARRRLAGVPGVETILGAIPDGIPRRPYELVVASEILYYLQPDALAATLARVRDCLSPGGRLVAVHWRPAGDERPFTAAEVHARLHAQSWLSAVLARSTDDYLLDVLEAR